MRNSKLFIFPILAAVFAQPLQAEEPMTISTKRMTLELED